MEQQIFIEKFIEAIEIEDASAVTGTTCFRNIEEWDSLAALSTISMIDDEFGVTINNKDLRSVETLDELYRLVTERAK